MKRLSQKKMVDTVKELRCAKNMSQEQLGEKTGINRQMIGRLEKGEYMPSISQLEELARVLGFEIPCLYMETAPTIYTAFRGSNMTKDEQAGVDALFEMMMASKKQILLRKAMLYECDK